MGSMAAHSGTIANSSALADAPGAFQHIPVLLDEVLDFLRGGTGFVVDATLGGGGHAEAILRRLPAVELFGCDRDPSAVQAARERLAPFGDRCLVKVLPFSQLHHYVLLGTVDMLLADLGVSSPQLDEAPRGFSFTQDGPLDMRMNPETDGVTAADLVNQADEEQLRQWFHEYGEERFTPAIVRAILRERRKAPILTTGALSRLVAEAVPARFHKKGYHPATQVFQALRIAVNRELDELETLLEHIPALLAPGGRAAVIAFHSLEDRLVKERFRFWEHPCRCPPDLPRCVCGAVPLGRRLTKKPVTPSAGEIARNPRARSAKLRVFEAA
jgi:16S rRNA (cytosine1402-N4)-methyltransferase